MDARRFDRLTRALAGPLSRRAAVRRGGAGIATATAVAFGGRSALGQDATPSPANEEGAPAGAGGGFLFVQTFGGGTFSPKPDAESRYLLALTGAAPTTVYFSDRPQRVTGAIPTQQFLDRIGFAADAPNAALVIGDLTVVVELLSGAYDAQAGTLTYEAALLADFVGPSAAMRHHVGDPTSAADVPAQFDAVSLFIDSADCLCCCNETIECILGDPWYDAYQHVGYIYDQPFCGDRVIYCDPCNVASAKNTCNATFPGCNGQCNIQYYHSFSPQSGC